MLSLALQNCRSVLCIGAHPDDIEIGCGASLTTLIDQLPELHVDWVVFSGNGLRSKEARRSAETWLADAASKRFLLHDFRDGYFPAEYQHIKEAIHGLAAECRPDLIFTHRLDDRHQDHRVLAELTWNAFRRNLILEYEIPKFEGDLGPANLLFPIDEPHCEQKISRLFAHFDSQSEKPWFDADVFRGLMRLRGIECGEQARYAEAFYLRKGLLSSGLQD